MPLLTQDYTIAVADTAEMFSVEVGPHMIISAAVMDMARAYANDAVWCEIGLLSGPELPTSRVSVIAQGFCGAYNVVAWDGRIPAMDDHRVYAMVIGDAATTWRLAVTLYKIVFGEHGEFRLDP